MIRTRNAAEKSLINRKQPQRRTAATAWSLGSIALMAVAAWVRGGKIWPKTVTYPVWGGRLAKMWSVRPCPQDRWQAGGQEPEGGADEPATASPGWNGSLEHNTMHHTYVFVHWTNGHTGRPGGQASRPIPEHEACMAGGQPVSLTDKIVRRTEITNTNITTNPNTCNHV